MNEGKNENDLWAFALLDLILKATKKCQGCPIAHGGKFFTLETQFSFFKKNTKLNFMEEVILR